jgi:hypothetical protein
MLSVFTSAVGYFESLPSFWPEAYGTYDVGPRIACYSFHLTDRQADCAFATQDLLVAKSQRHWIRLRLSLTISMETTAWVITAKHSLRNITHFTWRQQAQDVLLLLKDVLMEHQYIDDDTEIAVSFDRSDPADDCDPDVTATSVTRILDAAMKVRTSRYLESLRHQNVRIIPDTTFAAACLQGASLVANLDNEWVLYLPITTDEIGLDLLWRSIQASITLRGVSHVAQLVSVISDSERKLLKGVTVRLPSRGPMFRLMDARRPRGQPIPWEIRQKWAKQIVRGVAIYHERCQIIGGLRSHSWNICIDEHEDAIILGLSSGDHPVVFGGSGLLPPECRSKSFEDGDGQVGPEFDIFQLGLVLWNLYRDQHHQTDFCSLQGCNDDSHIPCSQHRDPISLPKAGADVPVYLDRAIRQCRMEDPRKRPAAWELLRMFPTDDEILAQTDSIHHERDHGDDTTMDTRMTRLEMVRSLYGLTIMYDRCSRRCHELFYTCDICHFGNYNECLDCFSKGKHCWNESHMLRKTNFQALSDKDWVDRVTCYTIVNEEGERSVEVV